MTTIHLSGDGTRAHVLQDGVETPVQIVHKITTKIGDDSVDFYIVRFESGDFKVVRSDGAGTTRLLPQPSEGSIVRVAKMHRLGLSPFDFGARKRRAKLLLELREKLLATQSAESAEADDSTVVSVTKP